MKESAFSIWYPLFFLIWLAVLIKIIHYNWGWWIDDYHHTFSAFMLWFPLLFGAFFAFIALCGSMGIAHGIGRIVGDSAENESRVKGRWKMVSLRGSDGVAGSISGGIFMLSGQIGSEQYYHFYTNDDDGAFHPHKLMAGSSTRIFEEDRKDGELVQWDQNFKHEWVYWFGEPSSEITSDFHIPRGSLKQSFALE